MGLFDLVFDELGKEIKEAPGWLSLVFLCNALVLLPSINEKLKQLNLEEEATVATLVAMALFFLGDIVDSFVFPREKDRKRCEKVLKGSMLLIGAFAVFLFIERHWWWAAGWAMLWIVIIPTYNAHERSLWSVPKEESEAAPAPARKAERGESAEQMTGFAWLVPQYGVMTTSRDKAREKLYIHRGVYNVSQALARKAKRYTLSIWFPNEAAKFVRSLVFLSLVIGVWLLVEGYGWLGALLIAASLGLLISYCWLKGLHMRKLYDVAIEIVGQEGAYKPLEPCRGVRLFLWDGDVAACVRVS